MEDPAAESKLRFSIVAAYERFQQHGPVLAGKQVFVTPGLMTSEADGGKGLKLIIEQAGGRLVSAAASVKSGCLIFASQDSQAWFKSDAGKSVPRGLPVLARETLVKAVMQQSLDTKAVLFRT